MQPSYSHRLIGHFPRDKSICSVDLLPGEAKGNLATGYSRQSLSTVHTHISITNSNPSLWVERTHCAMGSTLHTTLTWMDFHAGTHMNMFFFFFANVDISKLTQFSAWVREAWQRWRCLFKKKRRRKNKCTQKWLICQMESFCAWTKCSQFHVLFFVCALKLLSLCPLLKPQKQIKHVSLDVSSVETHVCKIDF